MGYGLSIGNIRVREFSHSLYTSIHEARLSKTRSGDKSKRVVFSPFKISRFTIHVRTRDNFTMLPIRQRLVRSC